MSIVLTPVEGKCNAPNPKRGGKLCQQVAGAGTDHSGVGPCKWHGGTLPVVKQAWAERYADHRAAQELAKFGAPVVEADPEQTLLDLVAEAAGNVAWLGRQVSALLSQDAQEAGGGLWATAVRYEQGAGLFGPRIELDRMGTEHIVGEDERAMVKLYGQWADRLAKYAKAALDAGIEKRRVEMAERQGETIVIVINNVFAKLGLPEETIAKARTLIAGEFRELESGEGG